MKERGWIEPIVERVVGQVLDSHAAQLRTEIVRRVMEEIAAEPLPAETIHESSSVSGPAELARAVAEIQAGTSQREILRALLDTSSRYAARVALFVVKGSHATGWQARGFANSDAIKDFALDERSPAVVRAVGDRVVATAIHTDLDPRFLHEFGTPASGEGRVLPLILKDKVAALIYADRGTDEAGPFDAGALDLLVLSTGAWLEVNALRKQAQKEPPASHGEAHTASSTERPQQAPAQPTPAFNDPFASHAPGFSAGQAKAAAASAGEAASAIASVAIEAPAGSPEVTSSASHTQPMPVQSAVEEIEPALAEPLPLGHAETASTAAPTSAISSETSSEDQDTHRKAQRFARLLVDEIKLYNQAKVSEGRKNRDLYDRLKEAIEKSRVTYQKRYGTTVAASGNYFQHEIIISLAEDDLSIMGPNFRQ
jgi:hypothetical protein